MLEALHDIECPVRALAFFTGAELMVHVQEVMEGNQPAIVLTGEEVAGMTATQLAIAVTLNPLIHGMP